MHESELNEMTELRRLKYRDSSSSPVQLANDKPKMVSFIEIPIDKTDTLQGLSLRYACKISKIKRLNYLVNDIDLHAKPTCRIPIEENSYLSEIYKKDLQCISIYDLNLLRKRPDESNEPEYDLLAHEIDMDDDGNMNIPLLAADSLMRPPSVLPKQSQRDEAITFLKNIDKDLENIKATAIQQNISITSKTSDTNKNTFLPSSQYTTNRDISFTTKEVFLICFLIIILVPVLIYAYWHFLRKLI
jgi:LysM repeat protein